MNPISAFLSFQKNAQQRKNKSGICPQSVIEQRERTCSDDFGVIANNDKLELTQVTEFKMMSVTLRKEESLKQQTNRSLKAQDSQ